MICKFFPTGVGQTRKATDYLQHDGAKVIKGNLELTRQISDTITRKRKYTSGVLSFNEKDLDYNIKMAITSDFERTVFPGLLPANYNITWVEHHDKNSLELHFISPRCEMKSGNDYSHYLHQFNKNKMDLWKDLINVKYDLSSPFEYNRALIVKPPTRNKKCNKLISKINQKIIEGVENRIILNRLDVIDTIKSFHEVLIPEQPKSKLKIFIQVKEDKKLTNIDLAGKAFHENFFGFDDLIEKAKIDHKIHIDDVRNNFGDHVQKLNDLLIKQTEKNRRIYPISVNVQSGIIDESINKLFNLNITNLTQAGEEDDGTRNSINEYITRFNTITRARNESAERFNRYTHQAKQIYSKLIKSEPRRSRPRRFGKIDKKFIGEFSNFLDRVVVISSTAIIEQFKEINSVQTLDDEFSDNLFKEESYEVNDDDDNNVRKGIIKK